jgi:hypothetical protein
MSLYHKNSVAAADQFCKIFENPSKSILNLLDVDRMKVIADNRQRLKPIIETVILMGRQKTEDGKIDAAQTSNPMRNDGNFRQLLKYRADGGDAVLSEQLRNSLANATYIGKTTQNHKNTTY